MNLKTIKQADDLFGKKVLLRVDFNVPLQNGQVGEDFRIKKSLPTIEFLKQKGSKVLILGHLQDRDKKLLSLSPVFDYLKKYFNLFIFYLIGDDILLKNCISDNSYLCFSRFLNSLLYLTWILFWIRQLLF